MYVDEVVSLFKLFVDEPDETFEDSGDIKVMAEAAHEELRAEIANSNPKLILERQTFSVSGARFYDFADAANATVLLGPPLGIKPAGAKRIHTIQTIRSVDATGRPKVRFDGVSDESHLWHVTETPRYYFEGTKIWFHGTLTETMEIVYVPVSGVDWTKQTPGDQEFIDDFYLFHDLIALKMAEQYMIRDGERNDPLMRRIKSREMAFDFFVQSGRDKGPGGRTETEPSNYWS